jgi:hypothetical protein
VEASVIHDCVDGAAEAPRQRQSPPWTARIVSVVVTAIATVVGCAYSTRRCCGVDGTIEASAVVAVFTNRYRASMAFTLFRRASVIKV